MNDRTSPIRIFESLEELSVAAAGAFRQSMERAIVDRGRFTVALAGGRTPRRLYRLLATEYRRSIPWGRVHLFWSDERFVPPQDPDSNFAMVKESLLDHVRVPDENVNRPETELFDPEESATRYERRIRSFFDPEPPRFDWILLGLGEDGHVASLFPGSAALAETKRLVVAIRDSPKPPPVRLTMTLPLVNASREIHFLVSGREKSEALSLVLEASEAPLPARRVQPTEGSLHWWLDRNARMR